MTCVWTESPLWCAITAHPTNDPGRMKAESICLPWFKSIEAALGETTRLPDFTLHDTCHSFRVSERMAEIVRKIGRITRYETKAYVGSTQILDLDKSTTDG